MRYICSIVIPAYNASGTIGKLLTSIYNSKRVDLSKLEIVVVDDKSTDDTVVKVETFLARHKKLRGKIIALKKNGGPAHARNVGARWASGRILFFLDSDVIIYPKALFELVKSFEDPDIHALTGVWDKKQKNNAFFPKFKALRDWSYWINERDPSHYYYLFSTRVAAIERDLFLRLGGFDETYKHALVEDIELTYRIARRYAVIFNPAVKVHHEFEGFWPIAKKYFWRSFYWTKIYRERKKFDPVATTNKEALTTISAGGVVGLGMLSILGYLGNLDDLGWIAGIGAGGLLFIHLLGVRKFLWFCVKEEGGGFAIKAFFTGFVLYIVILSGAFFSYLTNIMIIR